MNPVGEHPELPPDVITELRTHSYNSMFESLIRQHAAWHDTLVALDSTHDI